MYLSFFVKFKFKFGIIWMTIGKPKKMPQMFLDEQKQDRRVLWSKLGCVKGGKCKKRCT